jgi:hypothetical protein
MRYEAIRRLRPRAEFELTQDGTNGGQPYLSLYSDPDGLPPPTEAEILAMIVTLEAEAEAARLAAAQLRQQIRTTAAGAVGIRYDLLTAAQVRALVAILLWKQGALSNAGLVQPLDEWAR